MTQPEARSQKPVASSQPPAPSPRTPVNLNHATPEALLDHLLICCRADVARYKKTIINQHYTDVGLGVIVWDYLVWCERARHTAPETFRQVTDEMRAMLPTDHPVLKRHEETAEPETINE